MHGVGVNFETILGLIGTKKLLGSVLSKNIKINYEYYHNEK